MTPWVAVAIYVVTVVLFLATPRGRAIVAAITTGLADAMNAWLRWLGLDPAPAPRRALRADPERIAQLERDLGFYRPVGDDLNECPRCGGVSIMSRPIDSVPAPVCAPCATVILGEPAAASASWTANIWECCQDRDPTARPCMNGCAHTRWRREATFRWRRDTRAAAEAVADPDDFIEIRRGDGTTFRMLKGDPTEILAQHRAAIAAAFAVPPHLMGDDVRTRNERR